MAHEQDPTVAHWEPGGRVWIAFTILALSLAVLSITPVVVSVRTRALRNEITEIAEPTIAAASAVEGSLGMQLAALRGFLLEGDSAYVREYRRHDREEREATARLRGLAPQLDAGVDRHAARLVAVAAEWDSAVDAAMAAASGSAGLRALVGDEVAPTAVFAEARALRQSVQLLEALRREDIARTERVEVWTNGVMVVLAALAGAALLLIGRRLHALRVEAEARGAELHRSHDRRARLIRGLSHDLKNPLGAADAHASLLEMEIKGALSSDQRRSVAAIRRSIGSTVHLIEDLLRLARAERGELAVEPQPVDFRRLVEDLAEEARSEAAARGLSLDVEVPEQPVEGRADPGRVREILQNLLSNAVRYTPAGGIVVLRTDAVDGVGVVRISVCDDGPGVPPPDRERIFDEFQRAGGDAEGSGLGLAISRQIARLMDGEIELETEVGRGSTFTLVLPAEPRPSGAP